MSFEQADTLELGWSYRLNRSVTGAPLEVVGEVFPQGIGVHSRSVLTYELRGEFEEFVTRFGLDRSAGRLASVVAEIRVDGHRVFQQVVDVRSGLSSPIRIPVSGGRTLELVTDFGGNGGIQDRFDWIEPSLVRPQPPPQHP